MANAKRDIAQTGNKKLRPSTANALNDDTMLLLRKQMGPTAAGFKSKHCKQQKMKHFMSFYKKKIRVKLKLKRFE